MTVRIERFTVTPEVEEVINAWLDDNGLTFVTANAYCDIATHSGATVILVVATDETGDRDSLAYPVGASPMSEESDPIAYQAWVSGRLDDRANLPA